MKRMPTKGIDLAAIMLFSIFAASSVSYPIQKLLALPRRMGVELRRSFGRQKKKTNEQKKNLGGDMEK